MIRVSCGKNGFIKICDICCRGFEMAAKKNKTKVKNSNLLEIPEIERMKILKDLRESFKQKIVEAKMWKSLLELENIVINGQTIYCGADSLKGFYLDNKL